MLKKATKIKKQTKYTTISNKEFFKILNEVNTKYKKALGKLAKI